jgi:GTPase SAR1 family protein
MHIVLFGMPAAGKTSLLGALAQASQTQEHLLAGRLIDSSHGLAELQQRLYEEGPRPTVEEIVPYPVVFETRGAEQAMRVEVVFIDSDGRVANDLLVRRKSLEAAGREGTLAHEVLQADALLLVIDASAPPGQIEADFAEFRLFLRLLELGRGRRVEVGGLPVFLVLTKCDLLAQPGDAARHWLEHIEERKHQVDARFREFLARPDPEDRPLSFGRIDLHAWATAVKRPALSDVPARSREPFGVAELFRQCLHSAGDFQKRRRRAGKRLAWTVAGGVGLVALLLSYAGWVASRGSGTDPPTDLQNQVEIFRSREGPTPSLRLPGQPELLARDIGVLTEFRNEAGFSRLPQEQQQYVTERLQELREYEAYLRQLLAARPPSAAHNLRELQTAEEELTRSLALPRPEWSQTEAARLREERLAEVRILRQAVTKAAGWYQQLKEEGETLASFAGREPRTGGASLDWRRWQGDVKTLQSRAAEPPFREEDRLHGPASPTWRESVLRFESAANARAGWDLVRKRLERLRDLGAALGLGALPDRPPVLVLSGSEVSTPADCRGRLQELKKIYPAYEEEFRPVSLPEIAASDIRQAAHASYVVLLQPGREWVLRRLQHAGTGNQETMARWQEVQRWLLPGPEEFADWRILARLLKRLDQLDTAAPDPVTELVSFLERDRFEISLRRLSLKVPYDLGVRPLNGLAVYHESGGQKKNVMLQPYGDALDDPQSRLKTYSYRAAEDGSLLYRPGDRLWASLPLRKEGESASWAFSWVRGRSEVYQFEHLTRGVFLHVADQPSPSGKYHEDIRLLPGSGTSWPSVPDLLPVVQLH